ncbi:hypothetical protein CWN88_01790 [Vibrio splendidus]|nr:hypothetical protein CWN82_00985 [Vibrio splendidus]PTP06203.1 hypothetical protein CWN88_01790 [Vibrio splendidus]PTQ01036.1 hypothetical protein CWO28_17895 [Vibrio splendidus]
MNTQWGIFELENATRENSGCDVFGQNCVESEWNNSDGYQPYIDLARLEKSLKAMCPSNPTLQFT